MTVDSVDGASARIDVASGDASNWMGDDALRRKFMGEAGKVFGVDRATEILDAALALGDEDSVSKLVKMTRLHANASLAQLTVKSAE